MVTVDELLPRRYVLVTKRLNGEQTLICDQYCPCRKSYRHAPHYGLTVNLPFIGKIQKISIYERTTKTVKGTTCFVYIRIKPLDNDDHAFSVKLKDFDVSLIDDPTMVKLLYEK